MDLQIVKVNFFCGGDNFKRYGVSKLVKKGYKYVVIFGFLLSQLDELKERADGIETLNRNVEKSISEQERICKTATGTTGPKQFKVKKQAPSDNAIKKPLLISVQTSSSSPSSYSAAVQGNCVPLLCLSKIYCGGGDECSVVGPVRQKVCKKNYYA